MQICKKKKPKINMKGLVKFKMHGMKHFDVSGHLKFARTTH